MVEGVGKEPYMPRCPCLGRRMGWNGMEGPGLGPASGGRTLEPRCNVISLEVGRGNWIKVINPKRRPRRRSVYSSCLECLSLKEMGPL